jgi:hypothetical protein
VTDVANKLFRKFSVSLAELAGPDLANSFEEAFVWHLAWKKNLIDAYIAAGYLGSGNVAEKAAELLRKPDVATRSLVVAEAMQDALRAFSSTFQFWNVLPPVALDEIVAEVEKCIFNTMVHPNEPGTQRD